MSYATNGWEDGLAIGLPAMSLLAGTFLNSYAILSGELFGRLTPRTRVIVYAIYAIALIAVCWIVSRFAGYVAAAALQTT